MTAIPDLMAAVKHFYKFCFSLLAEEEILKERV